MDAAWMEESDRARLRSFFAGLLDERHGAPDNDSIEGVLEHAALLEIDLVPVFGLDVAVLLYRKQL